MLMNPKKTRAATTMTMRTIHPSIVHRYAATAGAVASIGSAVVVGATGTTGRPSLPTRFATSTTPSAPDLAVLTTTSLARSTPLTASRPTVLDASTTRDPPSTI